MSVSNNDTAIIEYLRKLAQIGTLSNNLISLAIIKHYHNVIPMLLKNGEDPILIDQKMKSPIYYAAFDDNVEAIGYIVDYLNSKGQSLDDYAMKELFSGTNPIYPALYCGIISHNPEFLEIILSNTTLDPCLLYRNWKGEINYFIDNLIYITDIEVFEGMIRVLKNHNFNFNIRQEGKETLLATCIKAFNPLKIKIKQILILLKIAQCDPNALEYSIDNSPNSICIQRDKGAIKDQEILDLLENYSTTEPNTYPVLEFHPQLLFREELGG